MKTRSWKNCTYDQLGRLGRDHSEFGDFCIMTDTYRVWLSEQPLGEEPKQKIEIPRKVFNRMVAAYLKERKLGK